MLQSTLTLRKIYNLIILLCISDYISAREIVSYNEFKNFNIIRQTKNNSCGAAALATMLKYKFHISEINEDTILYKLKNPNEEASFFELARISKEFNINAIGLALTLKELLNINKPVIAYVNNSLNNDHFIIINGIFNKELLISDPAIGNYSLKVSDFEKIWLLRNDKKGDILYLHRDSKDHLEFIDNIKTKHRLLLRN
ncbi:C39 family peptidase [Haemophilus influenzae]|uniref:Putative haemocin processing protein n=4 Tax=Haemophilus influenzae TaxID=727 RepID=O53037_HAEIF|nr:C39 family peptidase [Haemophilus influenzae]CVQ07319.1 bacteriocin secretion/processing ATP-binding protein [Streptococcus pneumoniae]AAC46223.1 putative haemocin processing protein [Haemophilus influenzae]MBK1413419.1 C39 family peptidase [Haemophilus influenzae]MCK8898536.1 C39 family peptidase [Haemophilus influenzae]MCK8934700.1 C39 family peptidase [Haemophilus influenzae]